MYILSILLVAVVAVSAIPRLAHLPQTCTPGHTTSDYCNSCECNSDGSGYDCTTNECPQIEPTCVPNTSYKYFCNTCRCSSDGLHRISACTRIACVHGMFSENGTLLQPEQPSIEGEPCVLGDARVVICDSCTCVGDPPKWACVRGGCI